MKKSKFFKQNTEWCGYLIDENGVRPKYSRTEAVQKIGIPTTVKEIRSFLGSVQYLAKFIENLPAKTEPIRQLLRKQVKWNWGSQQQNAFDQIKHDIAKITTLKHYDPKAPSTLTTDASRKGLGATLWQTDENGKRPVAFASRYLNSAEQNYAINELELLAVKWATEHFRHYLLRRKFTIETDHKAIISVFNRHRAHKEYSSRLTRWQMRLLPFEFEVIYKPGSQMGITDYLSRDSTFPAPPPKDESSLVISIIKQLNINKNLFLLQTAPRYRNSPPKQGNENKRGTPVDDIS